MTRPSIESAITEYLVGFYYACGRNDAGNPYVPPDEFGHAYAEHRSLRVGHHHSVQGFYDEFRKKIR